MTVHNPAPSTEHGQAAIVDESPEQTAEWLANERRLKLMAYWQECADAAEAQRVKRNVPAYPPPCDWMAGDEGVEL